MLAGTLKRHNLEEYLSNSLDRGPMLQQELHHFHSVLLTGNVKRSEAILCKETRVSGLQFRNTIITEGVEIAGLKGEVNDLPRNEWVVQ